MAINGEALIPALEKAKNIATEFYVDEGITGITDNIYYPGTTTIDGGVIATNTLLASTIKADEYWVGGNLKSADFTAVDGNGFRLKANAAATDADPTIYGAYIKGGYIKSATLDSSTIKVRDLVTVTDYGYDTKASFYTASTSNGFGVYPYNSSIGDSNRLASANGSVLMFFGVQGFNIDWASSADFIGPIITRDTFTYSNIYTIEIRLLIGSTVIGQGSANSYTNYTLTINGIDFQYRGTGADSVDLAIAINGGCSPTNISGEGQLKAQWRATGSNGNIWKDWTDMNSSVGVVAINI
jgi:hypothetical protein